MDTQNLSLLAQLVNSLGENMAVFEASYKAQDKESFDSAKKNLLEVQHKINFVLQRSLK